MNRSANDPFVVTCVLASLTGACAPGQLKLGGEIESEAGSSAGAVAATAPDASGANQTIVAQCDASITAQMIPADSVPFAGPTAACGGVCDCTIGGCTDGTGYLADTPASCSADPGPIPTYTSAADVAAAMVGLWSSCGSTVGGPLFFSSLDPGGPGGAAIELTNDGHFRLWQGPSSIAAQWANLLTPTTDDAGTGTYEVVDASAALGPGTYQARFTASSGGVSTTQVIVFTTPPRLRVFGSSGGVQDYAPSVSQAYQANVCGPALGPLYQPTSSDDVIAHLQGRWARCGNFLSRGFFGLLGFGDWQGVEFTSDGAYYPLIENDAGQLVRSDQDAGGQLQAAGGPPYAFELAGFDCVPILDQCGGLTFLDVQGQEPDAGGAGDYSSALESASTLSQELRRAP